MKLTKIKLVNFRNYSNTEIIFNEKMNVFIGDNAQGKTNVLESIEMLALTKSHRISTNPNIIKFGELASVIKGIVVKDYSISRLELKITDNSKSVKLNQSEVRKMSDYISNLNVIVFCPEDLEIIKGSPAIRRNLLNVEISQISKEYLNTYNEYSKILKIRNEYLKKIFNKDNINYPYLDVLTDKLIEKSIIIYQKRNEYINLISEKINDYYKSIAGVGNLKIVYCPNIEFVDLNEESIINKMKKVFSLNRDKEINYGMTLFGPHRDDIIFKIDDKDLKYYGSQGQQKLAILSFKLSEIGVFNDKNKTKPILLLDDIFGELDIKKRNKLLDIINQENVQSIITTTDIKNIEDKYLKDAYIFRVINGNVERR